MRRHWDLLRKLLLQHEGNNVDLSIYSEKEIAYHRYLLVDGPFVDGIRLALGDAVLGNITEEGHDFLSWARRDEAWHEVMHHIETNGLPESYHLICAVAEEVGRR